MHFRRSIFIILIFFAKTVHAVKISDIKNFICDHTSLIKKCCFITGGYLAYKLIKNKVAILLETEDKQIASYEDITVVERTSKHFSKDSRTYMMYKKNRYIGIINASNNFSFPKKLEDQCILYNFFILKEFRSSNYGRVLLNTVIDELTKLGKKEIYLNADPFEKENNSFKSLPLGPERDEKLKKLISFYSKFGFKLIEQDIAKKNVFAFSSMNVLHPMKCNINNRIQLLKL